MNVWSCIQNGMMKSNVDVFWALAEPVFLGRNQECEMTRNIILIGLLTYMRGERRSTRRHLPDERLATRTKFNFP